MSDFNDRLVCPYCEKILLEDFDALEEQGVNFYEVISSAVIDGYSIMIVCDKCNKAFETFVDIEIDNGKIFFVYLIT